jgi:ATP-binding protein involved in chromosome partitioning
MVYESGIKEINISEGCNKRCEDCETYFECQLNYKELFKSKGILSLITENLKTVKYKVIVLGGKGGVGKSMLTVNLAAALALKGKKVCVLDQVYDCPAIPMMFGVAEESRLEIGDKGLIPYEGPLGIKIVSTGLILDPDEIIIWFHDMKRNALEELLAAVDYGDIDYMVADIPPAPVRKLLISLSICLILTVLWWLQFPRRCPRMWLENASTFWEWRESLLPGW